MDERFLDVNEHGVLRIPGTMWLGLVLLARHWFWTAFVFLGGGSSLVLLSQGIPWVPLVSQLPVIVLLLAGANRLPAAGRFFRAIWRQAHVIILAVAGLNLAWTVWHLAVASEWRPRPELALVCFSLLDLMVAKSSWFSTHLRQVIAEFPKQPDPSEKSMKQG